MRIQSRQPDALRRLMMALAAACICSASTMAVFSEDALAQMPESKVAVKMVMIPVEGMACVACVASVKHAIKSLDGVSRVEMNLATASALVTFSPDRISSARIVAAIDNISGSFRAGTPKELK